LDQKRKSNNGLPPTSGNHVPYRITNEEHLGCYLQASFQYLLV